MSEIDRCEWCRRTCAPDRCIEDHIHGRVGVARIQAELNVSNPSLSVIWVDGKQLRPVTQAELRFGCDRPTELVIRVPLVAGQVEVEIVEGRVR